MRDFLIMSAIFNFLWSQYFRHQMLQVVLHPQITL